MRKWRAIVILKFIGTGSAFNTKLGNNGAYIKNGENLLLIDCGSSTFSKIQEIGLLEGIKSVLVLMTHTHPDHVGSLGDLIFYGYYSMGELFKPSVTVIAPPNLEIEDVLNAVGVKKDTYYLCDITDYTFISKIGIGVIPTRVEHVEELNCYGYIIFKRDIVAYYSGDCYEIPDNILESLNRGDFDYFYQDTSKAHYDGNVHLSLHKLTELVDIKYRDRVYCMHLDEKFDIEEAESLGFNVASNE